MAERELFVICSNCSSEVSPYVTECPYCGNRLRKRAPDIKKARKQEAKQDKKAEKRAAKQRERLRSEYEGGAASYLSSPSQPRVTILLILVAVVASLIARSGFSGVSEFMAERLTYYRGGGADVWTLFTAPFLQFWFGYGFICLGVFAMFGSGIERRFGWWAPLLVWMIGGAFGILAESLVVDFPSTFGAYGAAACAFVAWVIVVVQQEDLRDHDTLGLAAVAAVMCALPIATESASVWTLIGGVIAGGICGAVLSRVEAKAVF